MVNLWIVVVNNWDNNGIYIYIYIYLGKLDHDLTVLPNPGIMVRLREIIPFYGPTIQVGEILFHLPRYLFSEDVGSMIHLANCNDNNNNQWEFQDPKMELLYHFSGHIF